MRWNKPNRGNIRDRSGFLFFPKGKEEVRWLEYANWTESYVGYDTCFFASWNDEEK